MHLLTAVPLLLLALANPALGGQFCINQLTTAQNVFNGILNLPNTLNWNSPDSLWLEVHNLYFDTSNFRLVCDALSLYNGMLTGTYEQCFRPVELIAHENGTATNVSYTNAEKYFSLFSTLNFQCGAGFGIFANEQNCISQVYNVSYSRLDICRRTFIAQATQGAVSMECDYVNDFLECYQWNFRPCFEPGLFFGCEEARTVAIQIFPHCNDLANDCAVFVRPPGQPQK